MANLRFYEILCLNYVWLAHGSLAMQVNAQRFHFCPFVHSDCGHIGLD